MFSLGHSSLKYFTIVMLWLIKILPVTIVGTSGGPTQNFSTKDSSLSPAPFFHSGDFGLANTRVITSILLLGNGLCQDICVINIHIYALSCCDIITLNINAVRHDVGVLAQRTAPT